ncbi:unnamed protein product, partial [Coregonus sp. 'balchen']
SNGSTILIERGKYGESHPGGGAASRAEPSDNPQFCEGDQQSRGGIMMPNSLLGFQSRSPVFRTLSRSSSGYFSFDSDSVPSSPLLKDNKSTQTPSPSSQVITHALQRMSQEQETRRDDDVWPNPLHRYRPRPPPTAGDMRPETLIAACWQKRSSCPGKPAADAPRARLPTVDGAPDWTTITDHPAEKMMGRQKPQSHPMQHPADTYCSTWENSVKDLVHM